MHEASEGKNASDFINVVLTWYCEATKGKLNFNSAKLKSGK